MPGDWSGDAAAAADPLIPIALITGQSLLEAMPGPGYQSDGLASSAGRG
jgi:hypothetical protein